jgi:hypothetical protein
MEKIDLPFFYTLGAGLRPLSEVNSRMDRTEILIRSFRAKDQLEPLLATWPGLTVCRRDGLALLEAIDKWEALWESLHLEEAEKPLAKGRFGRVAADLASKAKAFETVLSAELQTLAAYYVTQKGIYSTPDLIERADNTLPESSRDRIPAGAQEEIRQSGRCLAFDNATACGFHMMRATEIVLHEYYLAVCKPTNKARLDSWGAYLADLRKSKDADVQKVVAILQQIKDRDRNLIMHPEAVLSVDDAFTLFEVGQGAIIAMAAKLRPRRASRGARKPRQPKAEATAEETATPSGAEAASA